MYTATQVKLLAVSLDRNFRSCTQRYSVICKSEREIFRNTHGAWIHYSSGVYPSGSDFETNCDFARGWTDRASSTMDSW